MAPSMVHSWEGNDWQEHVVVLLRNFYSPGDFQEVPDKHRGDFGIEGYSRDGRAYQCYAAQEPVETNARYELQRDKITTDLNKFVQNQGDLKKIFGAQKISRWILVVPILDSALLVQHCQKKTAEILKAGLPYVASDFVVHVDTDDIFAIARNALKKRALVTIEIKQSKLDQAIVDEWALANTNAVASLERKAKLLGTLKTSSKEKAFVQKMISFHLQGQDALRTLHGKYSTVYEEVQTAKASREQFLEMKSLATSDLPPELMRKTLEEYVAELKAMETISPRIAELLAHEAVSDWLIRCPLDFPEVP